MQDGKSRGKELSQKSKDQIQNWHRHVGLEEGRWVTQGLFRFQEFGPGTVRSKFQRLPWFNLPESGSSIT